MGPLDIFPPATQCVCLCVHYLSLLQEQASCHSSILVPLAVGPRFKAHSTTLTHVTCALYHPTLDTLLTLYGNTKTTTSPCKIAQHFLGFPSTGILYCMTFNIVIDKVSLEMFASEGVAAFLHVCWECS